MEPRLSLITLGVTDLARTTRFYRDGLGWPLSSASQADEVAGARVLTPAQDAEWGGFHGYFADPEGYPWEVAWNPSFPIRADGSLELPGT